MDYGKAGLAAPVGERMEMEGVRREARRLWMDMVGCGCSTMMADNAVDNFVKMAARIREATKGG